MQINIISLQYSNVPGWCSSLHLANTLIVTLHEVITLLVTMLISISSLQLYKVNRCGRSRYLETKLSVRSKPSSINVFEISAQYELFFFFFNNPAPPEIYPLPQHGPFPI